MASTDRESAILWSTEDGSIVKDWNVPHILDLAFTSDSRHMVVYTSDELVVRDMQCPFDIVAETSVYKGDLNTFVWSPDTTLCARAYGIGFNNIIWVRAYSTRTAKTVSACRLVLEPYNDSVESCTLVFSHDSRRLLITVRYATQAPYREASSCCSIWDIYSTAPPPRQFIDIDYIDHNDPIFYSSFNPVDSAQVLVAFDRGTVEVYDITSGMTVVKTMRVGHQIGELILGLERPPASVMYSPDGRHIATVSPEDYCGHICDLESGAVLSTLELGPTHARAVCWLSFSPDGTRILSISPAAALARTPDTWCSANSDTATVQVWDAHSGRPVLSLQAHDTSVHTATFSPDGRYIVSGYEDGTVRLWNAGDGACLAAFVDHDEAVIAFAFSVDGETLCSAGKYGTIRIRHLRDVLRH